LERLIWDRIERSWPDYRGIALSDYAKGALPEGLLRRVIERARHLGAYLQATRTKAEQARAGRHSTDQAVITETAVLDFLYA